MKTPTSELIEKYRKELNQYKSEKRDTDVSTERGYYSVIRLTTLITKTQFIITDLEQADKEWREKHLSEMKEACSYFHAFYSGTSEIIIYKDEIDSDFEESWEDYLKIITKNS